MSPLTSGTGVVLVSLPAIGFSSPPGLPDWASVGENMPRPAGTRYPRVGWYLLLREREKLMGEGICEAGLGGEELGCDWKVK